MYFQILFTLSFLSLPLNHSLNHEIMDKEIPKSELPKPFRKLSLRVSKSHLPGNASYKGSVVWQRTLSIDDIAARVVDKRSEYRKETLITTFNLLKREIYDAIEEGYNVDFGFGRTELTVNGPFETLYEKFDPDRHTLAPRLRPAPQLKQRVGNLRAVNETYQLAYTSMASIMDTALEEREGSAGLLLANCLLRDASDLPALSAELEKGVRRYNSGLREGQVRVEPPRSFGDRLLSQLFGPETYIVLGVALFLFLLVPALNLSGLNASRMQDRVSELGVRKAFGASRKTLMGQVFWENMLLMLPGGMAGLLFSYVLVFVFRGILLSPGLHSMGSGADNDIFLSPGMLLNMEVFAYAFAVCVALNLLSSMIPAWRTVRVSITDALNDK